MLACICFALVFVSAGIAWFNRLDVFAVFDSRMKTYLVFYLELWFVWVENAVYIGCQ